MGEDASAVRKKRLRFRSWHRGTREMDILLGGFADSSLEAMSESELGHYEALLLENDDDLNAWLVHDESWPRHLDESLLKKLKRYIRNRKQYIDFQP